LCGRLSVCVIALTPPPSGHWRWRRCPHSRCRCGPAPAAAAPWWTCVPDKRTTQHTCRERPPFSKPRHSRGVSALQELLGTHAARRHTRGARHAYAYTTHHTTYTNTHTCTPPPRRPEPARWLPRSAGCSRRGSGRPGGRGTGPGGGRKGVRGGGVSQSACLRTNSVCGAWWACGRA
jgi:hypothetical protein